MVFVKGHPQYNTGRTHFKKGVVPWSKGKKLTDAHRRKISIANKGNKPWNTGKKGIRLSISTEFGKGHIPWNKGKHGVQVNLNMDGLKKGLGFFKGRKNDTISKEKHWNWRGGITPKNTAERMKIEYKKWRKAVFERDDYTCQMCGRRGGVDLHADHIKPFSAFPDERLNLANGRTLCISCHRKTKTYGYNANRKTN